MKPQLKPVEKCAKCKKVSKQYNLDKKTKEWVCNKCYFNEK